MNRKRGEKLYAQVFRQVRAYIIQHNLQPGDLLGTGTLSGPTLDQAGALLELTQGGKVPLTLPDGQTRTFLQDGDEVTLQGWCEKPGAARIGFGECQARVLPATPTQT